MSEELIPPFTGPISKETAQFRAHQAVEYYRKHMKTQNTTQHNLIKYDNNVNGFGYNVTSDGRSSAQVTRNEPPVDRFVRGGQRATVHTVNSSGRQWQPNRNNNNNRPVSHEHKSVSKKRYSRGLYRSNSNLEESLEFINVDNPADTSISPRREYGSASSLDMMNASTSSDGFFAMLQNLRPENTDQRSPAPAKIKEVLRGSKGETHVSKNLLRDLERIANGSVIHNRPVSDEIDDGTQSPRTKAKFKQKDRKLRSKSITPETGAGVWKRIRGKNELEGNIKAPETVPESENIQGDERFRRKAFVHYDCQSVGFDANKVLKHNHHKPLSNAFSNISTGASAASGVRGSYAGEAEDPDLIANTDDGDGRNNDLVHSCSFFRNEIGGEDVRTLGLTVATANAKRTQQKENNHRSAISLTRSPACCGVTILDSTPTPVGHILPPYVTHKCHVIEYMDTGAFYYRHFFNGHEHQNYFGIDDSLGPVAVSVKREKVDDRENHLGKSESGLYQYRVIIRTTELLTLRGAILEDVVPVSGRLSSSRGVPIKDVLEFLTPELQTSCLRQSTSGQKTCDQLMKLDEQRVFSTYKFGIMYCKAGQSSEEEMYNNEYTGPAFEEFLNLIGQKVRLKGFENYRAQLDNKTDSTGTHSVYATFNNCEIMFHVSTLLPFTPKNQQQLLRKRHIGNDIVTIVFQEPGAMPFTAKNVRSQFQHVFIVVRAHHPCTDKTTYSIGVSRSKDVPTFGPAIPEHAKFPKSTEFAEFLLAKVINAEHAAHRSEKFHAMALRTRQEYLKDLATNYVTNNSLESASKLSKFGLSVKKKEKNRGKLVPDNFALGAIVWRVQVEDVGQASPVLCLLGIAAETLVIVEEATRDVVFTAHCGVVVGWTPAAICLRLYYSQGECLVMKPVSGDMEELQEIVTRLAAVTPGCETAELTLKRNGLGQLGFHIQAEGIVTDVEPYGFAYEAGLRKGSRLVEICKVATVTLSHDSMVDLLRTSATVKVVVIPPLTDGTPRGVVNLHANHHYSSLAALNAVIQAEYSLHQKQSRSASTSSEHAAPPGEHKEPANQPSPRTPGSDHVFMDMKDMTIHEEHETIQREREIIHEERETIHHERTSFSSSTSSYSQRSSNTLPLQKKSPSTPVSDNRGEMKSPPARTFYITDNPWQTSLPRNPPGYHGYTDSSVSSGRGSLFEGREKDGGELYGSRKGLDDSTYGTLEDRHTRAGSKDSNENPYGTSRDYSRDRPPQRPPPPTTVPHSTYLTSSSENIYSSTSQGSRKAPLPNPGADFTSVQHGNYAQELLKQSQNTKYLLSQGPPESSRSANSSSQNLSDTSFSSGGSAHPANMPHAGSHGGLSDHNSITSLVTREDTALGRRRANTASTPLTNKARPTVLNRNPQHSISPLSESPTISPRLSDKELSRMSSDESLSTRLRPGVTTRLGRTKASNNLQDELMRLIDPDIADSDLATVLSNRSSSRRLSGRLVRTMSDESLHSGKAGLMADLDVREALFSSRHHDLRGSREQLKQNRLSPQATGETPPRPSPGSRVPMPESAASLDWSSLVDVATKAIEGTEPGERKESPRDRISPPTTTSALSAPGGRPPDGKVETLYRHKPTDRPPDPADGKLESPYRHKPTDRPPDPPTASNPPVWRPVLANPQQRIQELETRVQQLEEELAQERQESGALDTEVQRLRNENVRLQEESQTAAAQLRRFTEWFFTTIDRQ